MTRPDTHGGPILRLFQVHAKPGCAKELMHKFASTSADFVSGKPGNLGYVFGEGVASDQDFVIFASVWKDLDAIKKHFGDAWKSSHLPPGYEPLIEECSVRHLDVSSGWHADVPIG